MLHMATDDVEVELEEMGLDISAADPVARKRTLVSKILEPSLLLVEGGRCSIGRQASSQIVASRYTLYNLGEPVVTACSILP